jgi:hypothetical protein
MAGTAKKTARGKHLGQNLNGVAAAAAAVAAEGVNCFKSITYIAIPQELKSSCGIYLSDLNLPSLLQRSFRKTLRQTKSSLQRLV